MCGLNSFIVAWNLCALCGASGKWHLPTLWFICREKQTTVSDRLIICKSCTILRSCSRQKQRCIYTHSYFLHLSIYYSYIYVCISHPYLYLLSSMYPHGKVPPFSPWSSGSSLQKLAGGSLSVWECSESLSEFLYLSLNLCIWESVRVVGYYFKLSSNSFKLKSRIWWVQTFQSRLWWVQTFQTMLKALQHTSGNSLVNPPVKFSQNSDPLTELSSTPCI